MTKQKLITTSAPAPSGEGGCSELQLFEQSKVRNKPPGLLDGMPVYLRFPSLRQLGIPWTLPYISELEEAGKFPKRVRLGDNTTVWVRDEIRAWQEERNAARDAAPAPKAPPAGQPPTEKKLPAKKKPATKLPARRQKDRGKVAEADDVRAAG